MPGYFDPVVVFLIGGQYISNIVVIVEAIAVTVVVVAASFVGDGGGIVKVLVFVSVIESVVVIE